VYSFFASAVAFGLTGVVRILAGTCGLNGENYRMSVFRYVGVATVPRRSWRFGIRRFGVILTTTTRFVTFVFHPWFIALIPLCLLLTCELSPGAISSQADAATVRKLKTVRARESRDTIDETISRGKWMGLASSLSLFFYIYTHRSCSSE
jgi:hypothetical protein